MLWLLDSCLLPLLLLLALLELFLQQGQRHLSLCHCNRQVNIWQGLRPHSSPRNLALTLLLLLLLSWARLARHLLLSLGSSSSSSGSGGNGSSTGSDGPMCQQQHSQR
jgi:hypothetical protein